jgi:hypothetical protein
MIHCENYSTAFDTTKGLHCLCIVYLYESNTKAFKTHGAAIHFDTGTLNQQKWQYQKNERILDHV